MEYKLNCVLAIDDDEPTNFFVQMILEEVGCARHIKIVQSGPEALEYLAKSEQEGNGDEYPSPDLIFLDINMPAMDGWEFLNEYKKLDIANRVIVVMLTTSLFPEDKSKAAAIPEISGFEHKPLTTEKVHAILGTYFESVGVEPGLK
ncbi:MAG TPA: response regulator [Chitinophagaceae bacterium]|nr:response regulator [Chitinophagaceae bacterium]